MIGFNAACRSACNMLAMAATFAVGVVGAPLQGNAAASRIFIVTNDRGGLVRDRANEIVQLRNSQLRVEIRANRCLSSCTMYLGAGDVCVNPSTTFGFHGPSYYGQALSPDRFEYWSQLISGHYPEPLRNWFMETGRYKTSGYYRIKGSQIIELGGYPTCT